MEVIRDGYLRAMKEAGMPPNIMKDTLGRIISMRGHQQKIMDTLEQQVPFQYFHLLNVMLSSNLMLWAYAMGVTGSIFAPAVYFCAAGIFCGLMELASQLANPFGFDEVDFPVALWVAEFLENSEFLIEFEYPEAEDGWMAALEREERAQLMAESNSGGLSDSAAQEFLNARYFLSGEQGNPNLSPNDDPFADESE